MYVVIITFHSTDIPIKFVQREFTERVTFAGSNPAFFNGLLRILRYAD